MTTSACITTSIMPTALDRFTLYGIEFNTVIEVAYRAAYEALKADPINFNHGWTKDRKADIKQMKEEGPKILFLKCRKKAVVAGRFVAYWYLNTKTGLKQRQIAYLFGGIERTAVSFAKSRIEARQYDPFLNSVFERFNDRIEKLAK